MKPSSLVALVSALIGIGGLLWPLWQLVAVSVVGLSLAGYWPIAICLSLVADMAFGVPPGWWRVFSVPFTLSAVALSVLRVALMGKLRPRRFDRL